MPSFNKSRLRYIFVLILLTSSLHIALNINQHSIAESQDQEKFVIDLTQEHLKGNSWWNDFLEDINREGRYLRAGGVFESLTAHLEFNFSSEMLTGSITGSRKDTPGLMRYDDSFTGSITGWVKKKDWGGFWGWEFGADVSLTLNFELEQKITNETGTFWEGRAETIHIVADLTGNTYAGEDGIGMFQINWQDDTRGFYVSCVEINERGACVLPGEFPKAIDIELILTGPDEINRATKEVVFDLEMYGKDIELIKHIDWYFFYYDEDYGDYWYFETFQNDLSVLRIDGEKLDTWLSYVEQYGASMEGEKILDLKVEVLVYTEDWVQLLKPVDHYFEFSSSSDVQYRITSANTPMKHLGIIFIDHDLTVETTTDKDGYYEIPLETVGAEEAYELHIYFEYTVDEAVYFGIVHGKSRDSVNLQLTILDEKIISMKFVQSSAEDQLIEESFEPTMYSIANLDLDDFLTSKNGLIFYSSLYIHMTEALEFYKDTLGENLKYRLPLTVLTHQPRETAYVYGNLGASIAINKKDSYDASDLRPVNLEYHEFSHFAMHALYRDWPKAPEGSIPEFQDDGYLNPSTSDSYIEGFAHFMSLIIYEDSRERAFRLEQAKLHEEPDNNDLTFEAVELCGKFGSLEENYKPWEKYGEAEKFAIAGVLWDLYDGADQNRYWNKIRKHFEKEVSEEWETFAPADLDLDNKVDAKEMVIMQGLGDKYKHSIDGVVGVDWIKYDGNQDGLLNVEELKNKFKDFSYELEGKTDVAYIQHLLEQHDKNKNEALDRNEVFEYIRLLLLEKKKDVEVPPDFLGLEISPEKLLEGAMETLPSLLKYGLTVNEPDNVDLSLEEIWSILRVYHTDFYSVYQAFIDKHPDKKEAIDEIFVAHGFYVETNPGNGVWDKDEPYRDENENGKWDEGEHFVDYPESGFSYDPGEIVGRAANHQRDERRITSGFSGHFIKVDNDVPFYRVRIELSTGLVLPQIKPAYIYEITIRNQEGLVYVPVPPPTYNATITIEPIDVEHENTFVFSSKEFHEGLIESIEKGYFKEYDFGIFGDMPPQPVYPVESIVEPEPQPEPEPEPTPELEPERPGGIPGFNVDTTLIGLIISVLIMWLSRRKVTS